MKYLRENSTIVLQLDIGEELIESLIEVCKKEKIISASVSGIGATNDAEIGVLVTADKNYVRKEIREDYEVTSLSGNITMKDGIPYPHIHATLANVNKVCGGHVHRMKISVLCEVYLECNSFVISRKADPRTGATIMVIDE